MTHLLGTWEWDPWPCPLTHLYHLHSHAVHLSAAITLGDCPLERHFHWKMQRKVQTTTPKGLHKAVHSLLFLTFHGVGAQWLHPTSHPFPRHLP